MFSASLLAVFKLIYAEVSDDFVLPIKSPVASAAF